MDRMRSLRGATRLLGEGAAFALAGNVTAERAGDGKLRCTCTTWDDAVVVLKGEALTLVNIERQVHVLRANAPCRRSTPSAGPPILGEDDFGVPPTRVGPPILVRLVAAITAMAFRDGPRPAASSVLGCPAWHDPPVPVVPVARAESDAEDSRSPSRRWLYTGAAAARLLAKLAGSCRARELRARRLGPAPDDPSEIGKARGSRGGIRATKPPLEEVALAPYPVPRQGLT